MSHTNKKLLSIFIISVISLLFITPNSVFANHNPNLTVSTENPSFSNTFAGPMITEVKISDTDISDTTQVQGEPDVAVNGETLRMLQSSDGNWYGYFADRNQALFADSLVNVAGFGTDFGIFCASTTSSSVFGIDFFGTTGFAIPRTFVIGNLNGTGFGLPPLQACTSAFPTGPLLNHVLINPPSLNSNPGIPLGQIGLSDSLWWPIIQLYDLTPTGNVVVQYTKGGGTQSTTLTFDTVDQFSTIKTEHATYLQNEDMILNLIDAQLNIDPTWYDSWTFGVNTTNHVYYRAFAGDSIDGDQFVFIPGTGLVSAIQNLVTNLGTMMFNGNGILSIDPHIQQNPDNLLIQKDNGIEVLNPNLGTNLILSRDMPVTLNETNHNSGEFNNVDSSEIANLHILPSALPGDTATISYSSSTITIDVFSDDDGDGIQDSIDDQPTMFSDDFTDSLAGTTAGTITRNGQSVIVRDEPSPRGVEIINQGTTSIIGFTTLCQSGTIPIGSSIELFCSSAGGTVTSGSVFVSVNLNDGRTVDMNLIKGHSFFYDDDASEFSNTGELDLVLDIDGNFAILPSGDSLIIESTDKKPSCSALDNASEKGNGKKKGLDRAKENNNC